MKTFMIGKDRSLKLGKNNDELIIRDRESKKETVFTPARWASFRLCLYEIDNQLYRLSQCEDVAYCNHYGGGWHISMTKGFHCIDLRKGWLPIGETSCKPTKTGIALRLSEWPMFKEAIDKQHRDNPNVCNFTPCFLFQDHTSQQIIAACRECNPFPSTIA